MSEIHAHLVQMTKMLKNLERWLDKAEAHAKAKSFEPGVLLQARLAPDMFPLTGQIQAACDGVKVLAARLSGREPPKHPDTEQTWVEIRARVQTVLQYVEPFTAADFAGGHERMVLLPFVPGKGMLGSEWLLEMNLPNTYFHLCMAYAILRHNGVDLGKYDYIGSINLRDL